MSIILGLLILCLGIYFLNLFFQVARMEKTMNDAVNVLERFMIVKYSLGEKKETKPGEVLKAIQKTALETPTSPPAP